MKLWGFHRAYSDGTLILLGTGAESELQETKAHREAEGFVCEIHPEGPEPAALRAQAEAAQW